MIDVPTESHMCLLYNGMLHVQIYTIQADIWRILFPHPLFLKTPFLCRTAYINQYFFKVSHWSWTSTFWYMLLHTLINIMAKRLFGNNLVHRLAKYLLKCPYYI